VGSLGALLPFVLIALVFWLLIVRPQRRRQQTMAATQSALQTGTEVMLGSGIYGRVVSADDEETTILVEVAPGTVLKVARQAVVRVIEPAEDDLTSTESPDGPDGAAGSDGSHGSESPDGSAADPDGDPDDRPGPSDQRP
jgi:preprotein translocase subunit YajC